MADLKEMFGGAARGGFLGLPEAALPVAEADIVVLGADCATPYASVGAYCTGGPAAIRAAVAPWAGDMGKVNFDIGGPVLAGGVRAVDAGDLPTDPSDPAGNRATIRSAVEGIRAAGAVPILLGGDDSVPIPMLEALHADGPLTILQIDAHIDWRDKVEGERLGLSSTMRRASEMAHVARIVQVGQRGIGSAGMGAWQAAQDWGAVLIPAQSLDTGGIDAAIAAIPEGARVAICLDVDALDPSIMPAVIAPTAGGLSYNQALRLIAGVTAKARVVAVDMVELMPAADRDGAGARTAGQLLAAILGLVAQARAR